MRYYRMAYPRVLFILRNRDYAYSCDPPYSTHLSSGLFNSAKFVSDMLASLGFETKLVHVENNNLIHKEAVLFKADIVIIEAFWVVPEKFDVLKKAMPNVTFVIRNHSDLPFLANEGSAINWTLEYIKKSNVIMSCNAKLALRDVRFLAQQEFPNWSADEVDKEVVYLPNYYPTDAAILDAKPVGAELNIGCFGAIRPLKNQLIQAVGAMRYAAGQKKFLNFHINGTRVEMFGSPILRNLIALFDHFPLTTKLVMHKWENHKDFMTLVESMDVVMQVSFSETFNIVSADAVTSGVPIVVSDKVLWASSMFRAKDDDSGNIAQTIGVALSQSNGRNLYGLEQYNVKSVQAWVKFLSRF